MQCILFFINKMLLLCNLKVTFLSNNLYIAVVKSYERRFTALYMAKQNIA